jgi:hypothetical protein
MVRLRIRGHERVGACGDVAIVRTVFCPSQQSSMDVAVCRRCVHLLRADDAVVECSPATFASDVRGLESDAGLGGDVCVGEAIGPYSVSVCADAPVRAAFAALSRAPAAVLMGIVVDAANHVVGCIERIEPCGPMDADCTERLARAVAPVRESATLAVAVARMTKERRRALPVVDDEGRTVGLISDLDALRWVARRNALATPSHAEGEKLNRKAGRREGEGVESTAAAVIPGAGVPWCKR